VKLNIHFLGSSEVVPDKILFPQCGQSLSFLDQFERVGDFLFPELLVELFAHVDMQSCEYKIGNKNMGVAER
jgi:hypothetical protein